MIFASALNFKGIPCAAYSKYNSHSHVSKFIAIEKQDDIGFTKKKKNNIRN